ncbi:tyrosine-type recombinase/integrase [Deinococcus maricopensis]|uniref:Integrase family protein n=1 Tax=Deinococcus maricopensis (strain DSM 21211 / LMG 22137 / NRRL B-23946 / LB-34) TaxID=709986 RepID=E8U3V7_DEIML|nr:tyrosine-type recombinase/integrase [Deinococcus maricopensis]ADV68800.1 integrase family protein [Deinococcus maricopensis DSM 21211]
MNWNQHFNLFIGDREYQGLSPETLRYYRQCWERFKQYSGEEPTVDRMTLQQYLISLQATHTPSSIATRWRGLKIFLKWCYVEEYSEFDPSRLKNPRAPFKKKQPLSEIEVLKLLNACRNFRDKAIVALLFDTGIRSKELCNLTVGDVDLVNRCVYVRNGKGGRDRIVPFSPSALRDLRKWAQQRNVESPWFFHVVKGEVGGALNRRWLHGLLMSAGKRAGLGEIVGPHKLRHSYARSYIASNGNPMALQETLGHSSIIVTQRYVNLNFEDLKKSHITHSPLTNARLSSQKR